ncbi:MAG: hypothetical protein ACLQDF_06390 [Desulfomonilia bacterium]
MNAFLFTDFLSHLLYDTEGTFDGHPVLRSKEIRDYAESTNRQLRLSFLPVYSPEPITVEQTWNYTKRYNETFAYSWFVTGPGFSASLFIIKPSIRAVPAA